MFSIQNPPLENPDPLFCMNYGIDSSIDFCVWVLERDGLRVPPFDRHPAGDGVLRSNGMTAEDWRSWITKTALLLDQRLYWEVTDLETEKQQEIADFSELQTQFGDSFPGTEFLPLDSPAFLDQITQHQVWQQKQFEKIKAAVGALYGDRIPPDPWGHNEIAVWDGTPAVGDRLRELREVYPFRQREQTWLNFSPASVTDNVGHTPEMVADTDGMYEWLRPYHEALGYLELHLVAYPYPVALAIPPNAIILSPSSDSQDSEMLRVRLVEAIEQLLELNNAQKHNGGFNRRS